MALKFTRLIFSVRLVRLTQFENARPATTTSSSSSNVSPQAPKKPLSGYQIYMAEGLKRYPEKASTVSQTEYFRELANAWKYLDDSKIDEYDKLSEKSREHYAQELKKFQEGLSDNEKMQLKTEKTEHMKMLKEKKKKQEFRMFNRPKNPASAYCFFVKDRFRNQTGASSQVLITELSKQWRDCPNEEKAVYQDAARADRDRYFAEMREWEESMMELGHAHLIRRETTSKLGPPKKRRTKIFRVDV